MVHTHVVLLMKSWIKVLVCQRLQGYACYSCLVFNNSLLILKKKKSPNLHDKLYGHSNYVGHLCDHTNLVRMGSFQSWFQYLHLPFCPNLKVGVITDLLVVGCKEVSCCMFFHLLKGHCFNLSLLYKLDSTKFSEQ